MTGNPTRPMRCHTSLFASECGYRARGGAGKLPSPELFMRCHGSDALSLRGRRSKGKGKGKGISAQDNARGRREIPLPLLTPATQARILSEMTEVGMLAFRPCSFPHNSQLQLQPFLISKKYYPDIFLPLISGICKRCYFLEKILY